MTENMTGWTAEVRWKVTERPCDAHGCDNTATHIARADLVATDLDGTERPLSFPDGYWPLNLCAVHARRLEAGPPTPATLNPDTGMVSVIQWDLLQPAALHPPEENQ